VKDSRGSGWLIVIPYLFVGVCAFTSAEAINAEVRPVRTGFDCATPHTAVQIDTAI